jgi:hypothetical protein
MVSVWIAAVPASAQSVADLVASNLAAKGGAARLDAVGTVKQTSRVKLHGGIEATLVLYSKRPKLLRQEMTVAGKTVVNAFDGTRAWAIDPTIGMTRPSVLSGPQADAIRDQASFDGLLARYHGAGGGAGLETLGIEVIGGRRLHHLRVYDGHHKVVHIYLDETTFLEALVVTETDMGRLEQEMLDYRDVKGVKVPFTIRTSLNGQAVAEIAVESVEFGVAIDSALFGMPKSGAAATAR